MACIVRIAVSYRAEAIRRICIRVISSRVAHRLYRWISLFREQNRRNFNAIMIAGARAAYLNGGFGAWEFVFTTVITYLAYRGLHSYNFIGIGWFFHAGWHVLHHLYGNPILPFAATSSLGYAICDPVIAIWCFMDAPSILKRTQSSLPQSS